jgi:C-terminal processing protease CtpA/Prc
MASRRKQDGGTAESAGTVPNGSVKEMNEALIGMLGSCLGVQESLRTLCLGLQEANRELNELRQTLTLSRQELREQVRELHEEWDAHEHRLIEARAKNELLLIAQEETADLPPLPGNLEPEPAEAPPLIAVEETVVSISATPEHSPSGRKAALGVTVNPEAKVLDVLPGTPAEKAGLQPGDLVLGVDGTPIRSSEELRSVILEAEAGEAVLLTVSRGEQTEAVTAQLAQPNGATILDEDHANSLAHS